jgi:hypothetical protein
VAKRRAVQERAAAFEQKRREQEARGEKPTPWLPAEHWPDAPLEAATPAQLEWKRPHWDMWNQWLWYRECVRRHALDPKTCAYQKRFNRPSGKVASEVWDLVAPSMGPLRWERLCTPKKLDNFSPSERDTIEVTVKKAFTIALALAVRRGEQRRLLYRNDIGDAIIAAWSDHARMQTEARTFWDMPREVANAISLDLLCNNIDLDAVWRAAVSKLNPLYAAVLIPRSGYRIVFDRHGKNGKLLMDPVKLTKFRDLTEELVALPLLPFPILLADELQPEKKPWSMRQKVAAGRPYNQVLLLAESKNILRIQEESVLLLNAGAFIRDYECAERTLSAWEAECEGYLVSASEKRKKGKAKKGLAPFHRMKLSHTPKQIRVRGKADGLLRFMETTERQQAIWSICRELGITTEAARSTIQKKFEDYDFNLWIATQCRAAYLDLLKHSKFEWHKLFPRTPWYVPIRSEFYRTINRRFQPKHFHPLMVTTDPMALTDEEGVGLLAVLLDSDRFSGLRFRWFMAPDPDDPKKAQPLAGLDICSDQTQIVSLLLGLEDLEALCCGDKDFKRELARLAWPYVVQSDADPKHGYTGPSDTRLVAYCKELWMKLLYGRRLGHIVADRRQEVRRLGAGFALKAEDLAQKPNHEALHALEIQATEDFLETVPGYHDMAYFLRACAEMARIACERDWAELLALGRETEDAYSGVTVIDPLDGAEVRWHHIERTNDQVSVANLKMMMSLPGVRETNAVGAACAARRSGHADVPLSARQWERRKAARVLEWTDFKPAVPHPVTGDWPIDQDRVSRMVSPCSVHMLDGMFSTFVMTALHDLGISCFAGIHDCWMLPRIAQRADGHREPGVVTLRRVLNDVAPIWFSRLGKFYDVLNSYLGDSPEYGDFVRDIRRKWQARLSELETKRIVFSAKAPSSAAEPAPIMLPFGDPSTWPAPSGLGSSGLLSLLQESAE